LRSPKVDEGAFLQKEWYKVLSRERAVNYPAVSQVVADEMAQGENLNRGAAMLVEDAEKDAHLGKSGGVSSMSGNVYVRFRTHKGVYDDGRDYREPRRI